MSGNLLAKWIIGKAEKSEAYRAGTLTGMKHPKPDREMIKAAGGLPELIRQADELEKSGYIRTEKSNLGADMKKIYYYFAWIMQFYEHPTPQHNIDQFIDSELEQNPHSVTPWILKGEVGPAPATQR